MLRFLNLLDEFLLLQTPLALDTSLTQNLLQLLDSQFVQILRFQILGLDRKLDCTNFRVGLGNALADLECRHSQGKGLRNVALDGVHVVAQFLFPRIEIVPGAKVAEGSFNGGLVLEIFLLHRGADVVDDLDTS
jgi:hypothetical protein